MTNQAGANYCRLPDEMQQRPQWCIAGPDKAPYLAGPEGLYRASPIKGPWLSFQEACNLAAQYNAGIGYIITSDDPYTCIDMDVKDIESKDKQGQPLPKESFTPMASLAYYAGIVQFARSYTELSASGKGLHVWVKGDIGAGRRGKGIEVYSRERFIICTGTALSEVEYQILNDVAIPKFKNPNPFPIADGTLIIANLHKELGEAADSINLIEVDARESDKEIWKRAKSADNSKKFKDLCEGLWQQYGFPSQSEADLALLSMFAFYSKSNEQCRNLFRQTALGQRDKAIKNDVYIDRTLQIIRGRQAKQEAGQVNGAELAKGLLDNHRQMQNGFDQEIKVDPKIKEYVMHLNHAQHTTPKQTELTFLPPASEGEQWPPGLVGAIAWFIYRSAPRPVREVAIVAALGLMAGITGKAYNIGQTGLNLYIILIARSAIGKEAMHSGIGHILRSPCGHTLAPFVNFTDYASGPALTKAMEAVTSFVNVSGEWGRKLQRMADDRRDGPMQQLRTVMTNLYQKSGAASVMGGLGYSNKDQNVRSVNAVAYSMIGETTPGTFYESLTSSMMEDGFLSRFNILEYLGDRPKENKNQLLQVPQEVSDALAEIASHCAGIVNSPNNAMQIKFTPEAEKMFASFNEHCDNKINEAGPDETIRQVWNRAHLKALRVAGVLAASDNYVEPVMDKNHAEWALRFIMADANAMLGKVLGGDIGIDDTSRFRKFQSVLEEYLSGKVSTSYNINPAMVEKGVVPRKYLQTRTNQIQSFKSYRLGATLALDHTVKTALDSGYIMEVNKDKAIEDFNYHGRCFMVLDLTR